MTFMDEGLVFAYVMICFPPPTLKPLSCLQNPRLATKLSLGQGMVKMHMHSFVRTASECCNSVAIGPGRVR